MTYPTAQRQPLVDDLHGRPVADPYRWLEDPDSPETREWLAAQERLWRERAAALPGRERLRARVAELSRAGTITAPMWRGGRRFFLRQAADQEHAALYVADPDGAERALLDPTALDPDGTITLDSWQPSWEGRLVTVQLSAGGTERSEMHVLDADCGGPVDGPIDRCRYSPVAWLAGGEAFFYVREEAGDEGGGPGVYLHRLGAPTADDAQVLARPGEGISHGLEISHDGRWLAISATRGAEPGNDLWLADLAAAPAERPDLRVVQEGVGDRTAAAVGRDGRLYVATDRDAPLVRLCVGDPARPEGPWRDLVPADPEAVLAGFAILDGSELERPLLLVSRLRHALGEIAVHELETGEPLGEVPLPGIGSLGPLATAPDGGAEAWFTYTDAVTPPAVHRYDARTGETDLWTAAPDAPALPAVESRRIVSRSPDGTPIRVDVLARPGAGPRPTLLYGYGGFGIPLTPSYSSFSLAWVEAGGVFANAHLRGGGEEGEEWHRAGMLDHKQNTFDDFIAAAEGLIAGGWTTPEQLAICGESNGGLLVGAALTQRPDLFAAAACSAPVLDMARYERSGLGPSWRGEYGSVEDPEQLEWLLAYSPYHRVREGVEYPAVLFTVFGGDTRVDPLHARKMCAALQWASAGGRPVLLRHEREVGHGDAAASRAVALAADMLAFLAAETGSRSGLAPG